MVMKSVHFLSRQFDGQFASHAATPPSTPTRDVVNELPRDDATRLLRSKSYSRIAPRRSLDPRGHQIHAYDHSTPWGLPPQQQFQKRSYSSPALWSFRKPSSLTPSLTPVPQPASPNGPPSSYFPQVEEPCLISEHIEHAHVSLRILHVVWTAIYSLWVILSGWLLIRQPTQRGKGIERRGGDQIEESVEEIEESEDDVLVTRAPKRSYSPPSDTDVRYGDAAASFSYPNTSSSERATPALLLESEEPVVRKRKGTPKIDLTPPTPSINQAIYATGILMTNTMIETTTITESSEPSPSPSPFPSPAPSSQLLPNPIGSCLLTGTAVSAAITPVSTPPPKKTPGLHRQKTLVLDLDETLIHSTSRPMHAHTGGGNLFNIPGLGFIFGNKRGPRASGHMVEVVLGGRSTLYHVYKRPFVDYFLRKVCSSHPIGWKEERC